MCFNAIAFEACVNVGVFFPDYLVRGDMEEECIESVFVKLICGNGVSADNLKHSSFLGDFDDFVDVEAWVVFRYFGFEFVRRLFSDGVIHLANK